MVSAHKELPTYLLRAHHTFRRNGDVALALQAVMSGLLAETPFERGMIAEFVFADELGSSLVVHALEGTAWNAATRAFYDEQAKRGEALADSDTLVGELLRTGEPVIKSAPSIGNRGPSGELILGIPLVHMGRIVGVLALTGEVGNAESWLAQLEPCVETCLDLLVTKQQTLAHELNLAETLAFTQAILDNVPDAIITLKPDGRVRSVNPAAASIFGYAAEEMVGLHAGVFLPGRTSSVHTDLRTGQVRILGVEGETVGHRKDGTIFPAEVSLCKGRFRNEHLITWIVRDLSDLRRAQRQLERFFALARELMAIASYEGELIHLNPAFERQLGSSREVLFERPFLEWVHPADVEDTRTRLDELLHGERVTCEIENRLEAADGSYRWFQWSVVASREEERLYMAARDVTEHHLAAEKSALLASIVSSSNDAIIGTDNGGQIISWNRAAEDLYGFGAEEAIGQPISILQSTSQQHALTHVLDQVARGGQVEHFETAQRKKDGSSTFVSLTVSPIFDGAGRITGASTIARDLSAQIEVDRLKQNLQEKYRYKNVIGESRAMQKVFHLAERVIDANVPVLITGESGVGKEVFSKLLHFQSSRRNQPFVAVNCAAIPDELLESELFGHERGSFTGAIQKRIGKFEEVAGGTLLLDEIGELDARMQAKLLRVLQERTFNRIGANRAIKMNARILAATNRDLEQDIKAGSFREDLYYRLNVVRLALPALRHRIEDLPALINFILKRFKEQEGRDIRGVTPQAMDLLCAHEWPGNIRELENVIFRAGLVTMGSYIDIDELPANIRKGASSSAVHLAAISQEVGVLTLNINMTLEEQEEQAIRAAMKTCNGDIPEVVRRLGISRATLYRKLKKYHIST